MKIVTALFVFLFWLPCRAVIYGTDTRHDVVEEQDARLIPLAAATAALTENWNLFEFDDENYLFDSEIFGNRFGICREERFFDQPSASLFCTAFLVGPDIVVTAGHCMSVSGCQVTRVVFGYQRQPYESNTTLIAKSQVYACKEIIHRQGGDFGHVIFRLNRPVVRIKPLDIDLRKIDVGEPVMVMGYPMGLPNKIAGGAHVREIRSDGNLVANTDTYTFNSGSPIFSENSLKVVGILDDGETDFVKQNGCKISKVCDSNGCRGETIANIQSITPFLPQN